MVLTATQMSNVTASDSKQQMTAFIDMSIEEVTLGMNYTVTSIICSVNITRVMLQAYHLFHADDDDVYDVLFI